MDPLKRARRAAGRARWPHTGRVLAILGLAAMLVGAIDPLEGSIVILVGLAVACAGALLVRSPQQRSLGWALACLAFGVGATLWLSALGGIGGNSRLSNWWGVLILPYPVGWVLGLVGIFRMLRDRSRSAA